MSEASLKLEHAAEILDCSKSSIKRLLEAGELKGHYITRGLRVYVQSITDYQTRKEYKPKVLQENKNDNSRPKTTNKVKNIEKELKELGL